MTDKRNPRGRSQRIQAYLLAQPGTLESIHQACGDREQKATGVSLNGLVSRGRAKVQVKDGVRWYYATRATTDKAAPREPFHVVQPREPTTPRAALRQRETVADFKARGGRIERIPTGW